MPSCCHESDFVSLVFARCLADMVGLSLVAAYRWILLDITAFAMTRFSEPAIDRGWIKFTTGNYYNQN
jgi:hypothetical protein